jgi:hypothetical protein
MDYSREHTLRRFRVILFLAFNYLVPVLVQCRDVPLGQQAAGPGAPRTRRLGGIFLFCLCRLFQFGGRRGLTATLPFHSMGVFVGLAFSEQPFAVAEGIKLSSLCPAVGLSLDRHDEPPSDQWDIILSISEFAEQSSLSQDMAFHGFFNHVSVGSVDAHSRIKRDEPELLLTSRGRICQQSATLEVAASPRVLTSRPLPLFLS